MHVYSYRVVAYTTKELNSLMDISVDSVCQFIVDRGGKVKNTVLVSHFKKILNDPATKGEF